jgi:hypothetical protein
MWRRPASRRTRAPDLEPVEHEDDLARETTPEEAWLDLQRSAGNRAVQRLVAPADAGPVYCGDADEARPLDAGMRGGMEAAFGEPLGDVRVHTGEGAAAAAVAQEAAAFTTGRDVVFGAGRYRPDTPDGRHLIAHEIAHVLQRGRPGVDRDAAGAGPLPEQEAEEAAGRVDAGRTAGGLGASLPAGAIARSPSTWSKDVTDAKAAGDAAAMADLLRTAIAALKRKVVVAKTAAGGAVNPSEYQPLPDLNFDVHLNSKRSKPLAPGGATRSLGANYGYWFTDAGKNYVVFGPNALEPESPVFSQMYVEHELFHAAHHAAPARTGGTGGQGKAPTNDEQELETWTQDFLHYFHQLRSFRAGWIPLVGYYEASGATARSAALKLLEGYYTSPPSPPIDAADVASVQRSFASWVRRRLKDPATASKQLIQDLARDLKITSSASGGTRKSSGEGGETGNADTP